MADELICIEVVEVIEDAEVVVEVIEPVVEVIEVFEGTPGPAGIPGSQWYVGSGPPPDTIGQRVNDQYLDEVTGDVYRVIAVTPPPTGYGVGPYGAGPYGGV